MESKWEVNFEDTVYLIISAGLLCLIISWILSVLLVTKRSFDYEFLTSPSESPISESVPQQVVESRAPPSVSQQKTYSLNIHPLEVLRIDERPHTTASSSQSSCPKGDCNNDG